MIPFTILETIFFCHHKVNHSMAYFGKKRVERRILVVNSRFWDEWPSSLG